MGKFIRENVLPNVTVSVLPSPATAPVCYLTTEEMPDHPDVKETTTLEELATIKHNSKAHPYSSTEFHAKLSFNPTATQAELNQLSDDDLRAVINKYSCRELLPTKSAPVNYKDDLAEWGAALVKAHRDFANYAEETVRGILQDVPADRIKDVDCRLDIPMQAMQTALSHQFQLDPETTGRSGFRWCKQLLKYCGRQQLEKFSTAVLKRLRQFVVPGGQVIVSLTVPRANYQLLGWTPHFDCLTAVWSVLQTSMAAPNEWYGWQVPIKSWIQLDYTSTSHYRYARPDPNVMYELPQIRNNTSPAPYTQAPPNTYAYLHPHLQGGNYACYGSHDRTIRRMLAKDSISLAGVFRMLSTSWWKTTRQHGALVFPTKLRLTCGFCKKQNGVPHDTRRVDICRTCKKWGGSQHAAVCTGDFNRMALYGTATVDYKFKAKFVPFNSRFCTCRWNADYIAAVHIQQEENIYEQMAIHALGSHGLEVFEHARRRRGQRNGSHRNRKSVSRNAD